MGERPVLWPTRWQWFGRVCRTGDQPQTPGPIGEGWLGAGATLGQICYGVEIVSTGGAEQTFYFTDFSISS